jgi:lactate racemase
VTRDDGAIILAAACSEGPGSLKYEKWVQNVQSNREAIDRFKQEGFRIGPHKAYQIARDSVSRRVIWVTDLAHPERLLLDTAPTLDEALARLLDGQIRRVGVIPYANATIPTLALSAVSG